MQYSAILIAAFAATAFAAPGAVTPQSAENTENGTDSGETTGAPVETCVDASCPDYVEPTCIDASCPDYVAPTTDYPTTTDNTYPDNNNSGTTGGNSYEAPSYTPVEKPCYDNTVKSQYAPGPYDNNESAYKKYEEYSIVDKYEYPEQIDAGSPCPIKYTAKDSSYKGHYKVSLCNSSDNYQSCHDVCDSYDSCQSYKPSYDVIPSDDSAKGCMYRFKTYEQDNEEKCTYSGDFPIYNPGYYEKNKDCKPEPTKCPPPKYVIPAPAPVKDTTTAVYPPVTSNTPVAQNDAPVTPPATVAPPTTFAASNETAIVPPVMSGSAAVRASFSVIVGMAAFVTFAL